MNEKATIEIPIRLYWEVMASGKGIEKILANGFINLSKKNGETKDLS